MKKISTNLYKKAAFFVIMSSIAAIAGAEIGAYTLNRDELSVNIQQVDEETPGYAVFQINVTNHGPADRTVHGKISLLATGGGFKTEVSSCIVYLEAPAGQSTKNLSSCRVDRFDRWNFELTEVYPFILESERNATERVLRSSVSP